MNTQNKKKTLNNETEAARTQNWSTKCAVCWASWSNCGWMLFQQRSTYREVAPL